MPGTINGFGTGYVGKKNRETREALARMEQDPDNPEAALAALGALTMSNRTEEAEKIAAFAAERFGDNAEVQMDLGAWYESTGRGAQADDCFERALELDPTSEAARRAVAITRLEAGDPDATRPLLAFMLEPDGNHDPAVLMLLAGAYQQRGQHEQVIEVCRAVLDAHPALNANKRFRTLVTTSEKALNEDSTILGRKPVNKRLVAVLAVAAVVLTVFGVVSLVKRANQTLTIVNGLPTDVTVTIDGGIPHLVRSGLQGDVTVSEGAHEAAVSSAGGFSETIPFRVSNGLFERLRNDNLFVLNPGGAATLLEEDIVYADEGAHGPDPDYALHFDRFIALRGIDHRFETAPTQIKIERRRVVHKQVTVLTQPPAEILGHFDADEPTARVLDFCENHLAIDPDDDPLLGIYMAIATSEAGGLERFRAFLESRLDRRPVPVNWHRMYQIITTASDAYDTTLARYERMLAADPGNSALLYLRGRLEPTSTTAIAYAERAMAADPRNPYAYLSRAYHRMSRGDVEAARADYEQAVKLKPEDAGFRAGLFQARLALGDYAALLAECREQRAENPLDVSLLQRMLHLLTASGDTPAARTLQAHYAVRLRKQRAADAGDALTGSRAVLAYLEGRYGDIIAMADDFKHEANRTGWAFTAHLALGHMAEAEALLEKQGASPPSASVSMMMTAGWTAAGDRSKADAWYGRALAALRDGDHDARHLAALFEKPDLTAEEAVDAAMEPSGKALALVALASRHAEIAGPLLDLAEKLNYDRNPPHAFLQRTIAALRGQQAPAGPSSRPAVTENGLLSSTSHPPAGMVGVRAVGARG